jgi:hypothetical protein
MLVAVGGILGKKIGGEVKRGGAEEKKASKFYA